MKVLHPTSKAAWIPATMYLDAKAYRTILLQALALTEMTQHQRLLTVNTSRAQRRTCLVQMQILRNTWTTLDLSTKFSVISAFHRALTSRLHQALTTWTALIPVQAHLHALVSVTPTACARSRKALAIHPQDLSVMVPILSSCWRSVQFSQVPTANQF